MIRNFVSTILELIKKYGRLRSLPPLNISLIPDTATDNWIAYVTGL